MASPDHQVAADADADAAYALLPADGEDIPDSDAQRPRFSWRTFWAFTGPGWLMSMAYLDPGNLEADLQSGAYARYELLYVALLSTVAGWCFQVLAARLGVVTGRHLAQLCRSEYPRSISIALWIMTELAIIGSDIQEVLGSAVALQLLFGFPLWLGCFVTGLDTFTFLAIDRADRKIDSKYGHDGKATKSTARYLELLFILLIAIMCVCFFADFTVSGPNGLELLRGLFIPRLESQNTMQAVATVGALLMPHNLFLHSALVSARGVDTRSHAKVRQANYYFALESGLALFVSFLINAAVIGAFASSFYSAQCAALSTNPISALYGRGLQTACVPVTAARASGNPIFDAYTGNTCVFAASNMTSVCSPCHVDRTTDGFDFTGPSAGYCQEIGLAEAGAAVSEALGGAAKTVWAIGLLASGQAATMTGTYAGQFVMEGFLDLKIAAWKRVALTRSMALVPAVAVAIASESRAVPTDRVNELLNVLQSVQLPFALLPLLCFTASKRIMGLAFATARGVAAMLAGFTALLCAVNYGLVYDVLTKMLPDLGLGVVGYGLLAAMAAGYVALLLYLIVVYPSKAEPLIKAPCTCCCKTRRVVVLSKQSDESSDKRSLLAHEV